VSNTVLTDAARNGIFRYWEGWVPGNAVSPITTATTNANPTFPSVDFEGKPLSPNTWLSGAPYTGRLVCFSVFGTVKADGSPFGAADCPSGTDANGRTYTGVAIQPPAGALLWDPKRPTASAAALGYFSKIMKEMPRASYFEIGGDGLNTATYRWLRHTDGGNAIEGGAGGANAGQNALVGSAAYQNRQQINIKIDQNFGSHRLAGSWTHQADSSTSPQAAWPTGLSGLTSRGPHVFSVSVTSTLSPNLVNEGRFGLNINKASTINPWNLSNSAIQDRTRSFFLQGGSSLSGNGQNYPVLVNPSTGGLAFTGLFSTGADATFRNPLYNYADTVSWTHGHHAFKVGADLRFSRSNGQFGLQPIPVASNGNLAGTNTESPFANVANSPSLGTTGNPDATNLTNLFPQTARNAARDLAYILTNSLGGVDTPYWAENYAQVSKGNAGWQDVTTQPNRLRDMVYNDFAFFAKDDWKLRPSLTLNLGLRWEYYAPPYITSGLTSTVVDQGNGLFGVGRGAGGKLFDNWLQPGNLYFTGYGTNGTGPGTNGLGASAVSLTCSKTALGTFASRLPTPNCDPSLQTQIEFIGPNSPNPGKTIIPRDRNNFGPAVGFAWEVPWFGKGKSTVRGGYQVLFQRVQIGESTLGSSLGGFLDQTYNQNDAAVQAIATGQNRALLLSDLPALVPVLPSRTPGGTIQVYGRSQSVTAFDPHFATPYTQNITLSVTRALSRQFTLDVRYVGNLSRKLPGSLNINTTTALYNKELFDALDAARRGENPVLLDQMLAGLSLAGTGNTTWNLNGQTGTYPTNRMYGPVGTCTALADLPGFQTPPLPGDSRCPAGSVFNSGAEQLRRAAGAGTYGSATSLANGWYNALANLLAGGTAPTSGLQTINLPAGSTVPSQRVLRNGCDRIANGLYDPSAAAAYPVVAANSTANVTSGNIPTRCFPENYLIANPQLSSASYNANLGRNNYHSLQTQFTMRPVQGVSFQASWTWAKSIGLATNNGYNDPLNRNFDRHEGYERTHDFHLNGLVELPIGPNKLLFRNSSGLLGRLLERWQAGFIYSAATGAPQSLTGTGGGSSRYGTTGNFQPYGEARLVPTQYWKIPKGKVEFNCGPLRQANGGGTVNFPCDLGTYFGADTPGVVGSYSTALDPQCFDNTRVVQVDSKGFSFARDSAGCTMRALVQRVAPGTPGAFFLDAVNQKDPAVYVAVNPKPGEYGVITPNSLRRFGYWGLDANLQKSFRLTESKQLSIRVDATNVLNHPEPFIPLFSTSDVLISQFGVIECGCGDSKSGNRAFQAKLRLTF
jgi:hypothetical protein